MKINRAMELHHGVRNDDGSSAFPAEDIQRVLDLYRLRTGPIAKAPVVSRRENCYRAGGTSVVGAAGAAGWRSPAGLTPGSVGDCRKARSAECREPPEQWYQAPVGLRMDVGRRPPSASIVSVRLVAKNAMPRIAVVRVRVLAAPRGENKTAKPRAATAHARVRRLRSAATARRRSARWRRIDE